jgi:hypothetical protein
LKRIVSEFARQKAVVATGRARGMFDELMKAIRFSRHPTNCRLRAISQSDGDFGKGLRENPNAIRT